MTGKATKLITVVLVAVILFSVFGYLSLAPKTPYHVVTFTTSATQETSLSTSLEETSTPRPFTIVKANVTVVGQAAGIPCGALRLPCPVPTNQSTISAVLIEYQGTYYYVSYLGVNDIRYVIWYDNSTYYCVTPRVEWANACPA